MASSGKFDPSSSSPGRPLYTSGKRGFSTAISMDRSTSFRDNMENPVLSSLPSMSRSTTNVGQGDVTNFFNCLRFDLKSMAAEYKCNRHGDFKRLANAALCAPDDSPSGSSKGKLPFSSTDDLKRLKVGLRESTIKARERVKVFSDVLSVMNKCFPSIPSRKRSRPDAFSGDRSNTLLMDRTTVGVTVGKMGTQSHALTGAFDYEQQKVEERGKNVIPNKRTRTSMVDQKADVRPNTPARSSGSVDREVLRLPNSNGEDRALPIVVDGWEKAKMKKKRSGIKADGAPSTSSLLAKPIDGCREPRQGVHPRSLPDARSRLNDSHGFRPGANLEQERINVRALNKANVREDFISGTPSSTTKLHAAARGPRSGLPKLSNVQRATVSNGLESPNGTNKNPGSIGSTSRKRTLSTRSSSPPVTQWADRRPQKISRTARRTNIVPVISTNDEVPPLGNSDVTVSEKGVGLARRFPANSPKRFKSKGDHVQSSTLSESEDNGSKSEEVEGKAGLNVQKLSTLVLPTRKNKLIRSNLVPVAPVEKLGNVGTAKQLRTGKVGFDKPQSKLGRPPTRKLSGRKAYTRQKQSAVTPPMDFLVGSGDGHEELVAAANAVVNPDRDLSSPFWRQMDPLFGFVSDADVSYINQEGSIRSTVNTTNPIDSCDTHLNGFMSVEPPKIGTESISECSEHLMEGTSLCQRLLAALISEEDNEYTVYGSVFELETDVESNGINSRSLQNFELGTSFSSGYRIGSATATGFDHCYNGLLSDSTMAPSITCSEYQYGNMSMDERLLMEIHSLGLYPAPVPDLVHTGDEDISRDISKLEKKHHEQASRKKSLLDKLIKSTEEARELDEKEFERLSLDKLTGMSYQKYMSCWGPNAPGGKSANGKMAKQVALDCVKRTLERCHEFESTGKSCFSEPVFREIFVSGLSRSKNAEVDVAIDGDSGKAHGSSIEKVSGTQLSPSLNNHEIHQSEQTIGKDDDVWSIKGKKRELYLDDVAGVGRTVSNSAKGKRSERDRNGGPKLKGERKTKSKLKQKTTQLSASINGPLGKISDQQRTKPSSVPNCNEIKSNQRTVSEDIEEPPLDLSHLQLPEMDDFGGQGEDIGSWLNIEDDGLQDDDFMGLEIPMDDLTDLNMMV